MTDRSRAQRIVLCLAAAGLLATALGAWHGHDSSLDACMLCHTGQVPALAVSSPHLEAPGVFAWGPVPAEPVMTAVVELFHLCPRAPPA